MYNRQINVGEKDRVEKSKENTLKNLPTEDG